MWYPSQEQQQQYSWYGYAQQPTSSQLREVYSRTPYYCNDEEFSTTSLVTINNENESSVHCQAAYDVTTPDGYVITSNSSYGDEMSSYQTIPTRKPYWSPVIAAPNKIIMPSLPVTSSSSSWDWLLFSPEYYSEFYTPSSTSVHYQKFEEEEIDGQELNLLASLPTCLLTLLYLTPKLIRSSDEENETDREISSLRRSNELLSSEHNHPSISNITGQTNRSSTPDTDDGYQSASDASRSDCSQQSSVPSDPRSHDYITINEQPLSASLMPRRISYAAAAKPIQTSSFPTPIGKAKQSTNNAPNDLLNSNSQKTKFIAPRFERMHHAKQNASSSSSSPSVSSSNRTQTRSNNNNHHQRYPTINPTRRR